MPPVPNWDEIGAFGDLRDGNLSISRLRLSGPSPKWLITSRRQRREARQTAVTCWQEGVHLRRPTLKRCAPERLRGRLGRSWSTDFMRPTTNCCQCWLWRRTKRRTPRRRCGRFWWLRGACRTARPGRTYLSMSWAGRSTRFFSGSTYSIIGHKLRS
jgi:hypothetical protein